MSKALLTTREKIFLLLINSSEPISAKEIKSILKISREKEVYEHITHIFKSSKRRGDKVIIIPAVCKECGFVFNTDKRIKMPSRCPRCKSNKILSPRFYAVKVV